MVGFIIPIPGKVVDGIYNSGSNLAKSYKKEPLPTDLGASSQGQGQDVMYEKPVPPPARRSTSNAGRWSQPNPTPSAPPPSRTTGGGSYGNRSQVGNNAPNLDTFGPQLLAHVLDSINLLESLGQISPDAAQCAAAALNGSGPSGPSSGGGYAVPPPPSAASRAPPPKPSAQNRATALWDYGQGAAADDDDLTFAAGDTIIIDEEINDEWMRGRTIPQGRTIPLAKQGLFPANYVERQ